ncbi:hypothetical protein [Streptacidiphilus jiangxiensis]|nr:hypothetical protein [Streptacidiphilus jiangxiensis]
MSLFGRRPRLTPELNDHQLSKLTKKLTAHGFSGQLELTAAASAYAPLVDRLLRDVGTDWDRRCHRLSVLAGTVPRTVAQAWLRQRPKDASLILLSAWMDLLQGRREGALHDPGALIARCHQAIEARPDDPTPWTVLLGTLRTLWRPQAEVFPVWREIVARDRWHRAAHLEMLGYLSPEECGSHPELLEFVDAARSRAPRQSPVAALELTMLVDRYEATVAAGGVASIGAERRWSRPLDAAVLDDAVTYWPRPGHLVHAAALADLNLLAYALVRAERLRDAAGVFQAIGGAVTSWPWELSGDPLKEFTYWSDRSRDR